MAKIDRLGAPHRWKIGIMGIVAVAVPVLVLLFEPSAPGGLENGSFLNDCCGSLRLRDGEVILNDKLATRYTVGRDGRGYYVLPRSYVGGLEDIGFEIDGSRPAAKLRLDHIPNPTILMVGGGGKTYLFERRPAISRTIKP